MENSNNNNNLNLKYDTAKPVLFFKTVVFFHIVFPFPNTVYYITSIIISLEKEIYFFY